MAGHACQQPLVEHYNAPSFTVILSHTASFTYSIHRACPHICVFNYHQNSLSACQFLTRICLSQTIILPLSPIDSGTFCQKLPGEHGSYLKNTMDNASDSSIELLGSSVCQVCQGLGDLRNPRGAFTNIPERDGFLYRYMHHPSVPALVRSSEAGCRVCTVLRYTVSRDGETYFNGIGASMHRESTMNTKQSAADDVSLATRLAECAKSKNSSQLTELDLGNTGKGRIVIEHFPCDELGLRGTTSKFHGTVYALVDDLSSALFEFFYGFQTSCRPFPPR